MFWTPSFRIPWEKARFEVWLETFLGASGVVDKNLAYYNTKSWSRADSWVVLREVSRASRPSRDSEDVVERALFFDFFFVQGKDFLFLAVFGKFDKAWFCSIEVVLFDSVPRLTSVRVQRVASATCPCCFKLPWLLIDNGIVFEALFVTFYLKSSDHTRCAQSPGIYLGVNHAKTDTYGWSFK